MSAHSPQEPAVPGFFRITRWTLTAGETFTVWRDHFNQRGIQTRVVRDSNRSALYRDGIEAVSHSGWRERRRKENTEEP